jgi:quercetin dioxygenase-like cupin family protein
MFDIFIRQNVWATLALVMLTGACAKNSERPTVTSPRSNKTAPITRTLLGQHDIVELPGWEQRLYLIEYAPGVAAPLHHHPVQGLGYVISGSFESAFAGEAPVVVHQGQSFIERAEVAHTLFRNVDSVRPLQFVIGWVVPKGAPVLVAP